MMQLMSETSQRKAIRNGMILPDTNTLGFTSEKFEGWLWKKADSIYISFIESKQPGRGHFSQLLKAILDSGHSVKVPTPFAKMQQILVKKGFTKTIEQDEEMGAVEVWVLE